MTIEKIKTKISEYEAKRNAVLEKLKPLNASLAKYSKEISKLNNDLAIEQLKTKCDDLAYLLSPEAFHGEANYEARAKWAAKYGVHFSGYYPQIMQPTTTISLKHNQDISKLRDTILLMVPHYKPIEGSVIFQITDNDMCASGILTLWVSPDATTAKIVKTTYGSDRTLFSGTLDEALTEMSKEYWYEYAP